MSGPTAEQARDRVTVYLNDLDTYLHPDDDVVDWSDDARTVGLRRSDLRALLAALPVEPAAPEPPECPTCGKREWSVTHSCTGIRVEPAADARPASPYVDMELPDFHPETGHLHTCEDRATCSCAAWLFSMAAQYEDRLPAADARLAAEDDTLLREQIRVAWHKNPTSGAFADRLLPLLNARLAEVREQGRALGVHEGILAGAADRQEMIAYGYERGLREAEQAVRAFLADVLRFAYTLDNGEDHDSLIGLVNKHRVAALSSGTPTTEERP